MCRDRNALVLNMCRSAEIRIWEWLMFTAFSVVLIENFVSEKTQIRGDKELFFG